MALMIPAYIVTGKNVVQPDCQNVTCVECRNTVNVSQTNCCSDCSTITVDDRLKLIIEPGRVIHFATRCGLREKGICLVSILIRFQMLFYIKIFTCIGNLPTMFCSRQHIMYIKFYQSEGNLNYTNVRS